MCLSFSFLRAASRCVDAHNVSPLNVSISSFSMRIRMICFELRSEQWDGALTVCPSGDMRVRCGWWSNRHMCVGLCVCVCAVCINKLNNIFCFADDGRDRRSLFCENNQHQHQHYSITTTTVGKSGARSACRRITEQEQSRSSDTISFTFANFYRRKILFFSCFLCWNSFYSFYYSLVFIVHIFVAAMGASEWAGRSLSNQNKKKVKSNNCVYDSQNDQQRAHSHAHTGSFIICLLWFVCPSCGRFGRPFDFRCAFTAHQYSKEEEKLCSVRKRCSFKSLFSLILRCCRCRCRCMDVVSVHIQLNVLCC